MQSQRTKQPLSPGHFAAWSRGGQIAVAKELHMCYSDLKKEPKSSHGGAT